MPKSKRKPHPKPAAVPPAVPVALSAPASELSVVDKVCRACSTLLPAHARFCSRCGEPQVDGLQRPVPLAAVPEQSTPEPAPAAVKPSQFTVPSTPKVPPVKPLGPLLVPALAADRSIPASLLQTDLSVPLQAMPSDKPVVAATAVIHKSSVENPPTQAGDPSRERMPEPKVQRDPLPEPHAQTEPQPLFDSSTEARILSLRAGREITLERIDRVMTGFKLRPKPVVKPKPAKKADAKADKKADNKADKKADKKSKGH